MSNQKTSLIIPDMHCQSCPKLVKITLSELPGVISVDASLETKKVKVDYDDDSVTTDQMINAIKEIGYEARLL